MCKRCQKCVKEVNISVMGSSSAMFTDHVIAGGGILQTKLQCSQEIQYEFYKLIYQNYLQER